MNKQKSQVLLGTAHPFRGGLAAFNERLATQFQQEGWEVIIYTFSLQYPGFLFPGKSQYADWEAPAHLNIRVRVHSVNPLNWLRVGREIARLCPEVLLIKFWIPFMGPCFGSIARLVRRNRHTRVVCIADNIIPHEKRPGDMLLTRYFTRSVDAFVAMSRSVQQDIAAIAPGKPCSFHPHPLFDNFGEPVSRATALEHLQLDNQYSYLLFFGFIRAYKGLDWLLEAFADPRLACLPVRLIIAGEFYEDSKPYTDQIARLQLEHRVVLRTDFIPDDQVKYFFCAADLIVQPYKTATQSGVTQIGYHFGKPMLVTDVGGLSEIIPHGEAGYVVSPQPAAIAEALVDFCLRNRQHHFDAGLAREKQKYQWAGMSAAVREAKNG